MNDRRVRILAIETSCDETAAAVVCNGREVLSNVIYTQIPIHTEYGGVVPEIASRSHVEKIVPVVRKALKDADMTIEDADAVAVTYGPGLVGPLLVGVSCAKALAYAADKPLVGVHHIEGHISANYIEHPDLEPPYICLVVSGGHSHLVEVKDYGSYEIIARTRDDAAGEAFDKVARAIGLGYPGGPKIDAAAREGDPFAIDFPRGKVRDSEYDFSFSGVKSSVLNYINSCKMQDIEVNVNDVAASFQRSVVEVLTEHAMKAVDERGLHKFTLAGGVASNTALRESLKKACDERNVDFCVPSPVFCTDNAAMIGAAAYYEYISGVRDGLDLNAVPNLMLGDHR
ncbi:MAG: tRNA (adenosine(37)-N6)-threonylcarbamoyltransferase complex transferase subunit TsaD [Lachnospiraceae bacterium]|nr:tRNA (adenosine(37)-N6)-threonylcarbamoyltransferase complex transferase subunit TsaD [Lachnospiraceae bacterium]